MMSDLEFSGTESDAVSDVNPEEMARLMADIDEIDDNLFKSNLKATTTTATTTTTTRKEDKQSKRQPRQVTFSDKGPPGGEGGSDDDWDADDLLHSDDAMTQSKPTMKPQSPGKPSPPSPKEKNQRSKDKKKLMAELFSDESAGKTKSPIHSESSAAAPAAPRKDKLMAELFGDGDGAAKPNSSMASEKATPKSNIESAGNRRMKKTTKDTMFDDDGGGDLLGDLTDTQKRPSTSPVGGSFMDSLLSKSSALDKPARKGSSEFILDDKYKSTTNLSQYEPSSGAKTGTPRRGTPSKSPGKEDLKFDFLSDADRKRRGSRSAPQRKPFEIDNDDIFDNMKPNRRANKEITSDPKRASSAPGTQKESTKSGRKDDWLFEDSGEGSEAVRRNIEANSVTASVEKSDSSNHKSPSQNQDWLGDLLSSNKKSPSTAKQSPVQGSNRDTKNPTQTQPPVTFSLPSTAAAAENNAVAGVAVTSSNPVNASAAPSIVPSLPLPVEGMQINPQNVLSMQQQQQQQELQADAFAAHIQSQQEQLHSYMAQQLQQQQQMMANLLKQQQQQQQDAARKRYEDAMSSITPAPLTPAQEDTSTDQHRNIEAKLKEAEIEAAKARTELDLIRKQHEQEVTLLEASYRRQLETEREIWGRVEARLREERDSLLSDFQDKITLLQEEKRSLLTSYQAQLSGVKEEWSQAVERSKELYTGMLERVREEHSSALQRMSHLKDLELKAAVAASGHVREVEVVMTQLETNTSDLTELTTAINTRHDSALELTQRALKMKEKQLQDFEGQLLTSRAEAESERGRLNTLIHRLENTLMQQGSEVEKEHWRLAQERMKVDTERQALMEERKHLQLSIETERQNLSKARKDLLSEHQTLLQSVAQQKQELANAQADLSRHQMLPHRVAAAAAAGIPFNKMSVLGLDAEVSLVSEEQRRLQEKISSVSLQQQYLKEEETRLNELSLQLEQDRLKMDLQREGNVKESAMIKKAQQDNESAKEELKALRQEQQERLSQIAAQTRSLHQQQERIDKEHMRLEQLRQEIVRLSQGRVCSVCQSRGGIQLLLEPSSAGGRHRLPGDGGEEQAPSTLPLAEVPRKVDRSPASVLTRLAAARKQENKDREKRLLRISALEST